MCVLFDRNSSFLPVVENTAEIEIHVSLWPCASPAQHHPSLQVSLEDAGFECKRKFRLCGVGSECHVSLYGIFVADEWYSMYGFGGALNRCVVTFISLI